MPRGDHRITVSPRVAAPVRRALSRPPFPIRGHNNLHGALARRTTQPSVAPRRTHATARSERGAPLSPGEGIHQELKKARH